MNLVIRTKEETKADQTFVEVINFGPSTLVTRNFSYFKYSSRKKVLSRSEVLTRLEKLETFHVDFSLTQVNVNLY